MYVYIDDTFNNIALFFINLKIVCSKFMLLYATVHMKNFEVKTFMNQSQNMFYVQDH